MPTLPELQRDFMQAVLEGSCTPLLGEIVAGDRAPSQRLAIYANNAETNFIESLRLSFPAIRRLVGDAYFTQCAREYRAQHPSRSGDLQHVGAAFPDYWADRHGRDEFRYLADIARLEWLYQEALTGRRSRAIRPRASRRDCAGAIRRPALSAASLRAPVRIRVSGACDLGSQCRQRGRTGNHRLAPRRRSSAVEPQPARRRDPTPQRR